MKKVEEDYFKIIGNNIKTARLLKRLTQEQLAEKLNKSVNFISLIERGKSGLGIRTIIDICNILEIDSNCIFNNVIKYNADNNEKYILDNISVLSDKDKEIVKNLIQYILESKK